MRKTHAFAVAAFGLLATTPPLHAQAQFPDKPIKMVVGYSAGGGSDVLARSISSKLSQRLGQPVVVDNKPGASGMIGAEYVAKSKPDGYTLIMMSADSHSIAPHVYPKMRYSTTQDFTPLALIGFQPMGLVVRTGIPVTTVKEFIEYAGSSKEALTFSSYGIGSSSHVAMAMLEQYGGVKLRHIPYPGSAPAIGAVIAGVVDAMMVPTALAIPNHKNGKVKLIAVATEKESAVAAGYPTFASQGIPLDTSIWMGIMGPANIPAATVMLLNEELNAVIADEGVRRTLQNTGTEVLNEKASSERFKAFSESESGKWGQAVKKAAISISE